MAGSINGVGRVSCRGLRLVLGTTLRQVPGLSQKYCMARIRYSTWLGYLGR